METVSIALCTYNGERFLDEQLRSISEQSRLPDEVVVCDDRSTDSTWEILERFRDNAPFPVRLTQNETTLGSTKNFENAITLCSGEIIFLCDQDDVWNSIKIERMAVRFERDDQLAILFSNGRLVDENLKPLGRELWDLVFPNAMRKAFTGQPFETLLWQNAATGAAMAFRSRYRNEILPFPQISGQIHDAWIALVLSQIGKIDTINEPLFSYRQHSGQQLGVGVSDVDRVARFERSLAINEGEMTRLKELLVLMATHPLFAGTNHDARIESYLAKREDISEHYRNRIGQSVKITTRIRQIFEELGTGRYSKYSNGILSAAKDLFRR
jgi:Glycosyltransferases involved in cell wall biogenesis